MSSPPTFKSFAVVIKNHYQPTYSLRITIDSADTNIGKLKCMVNEQHKGNPAVQDQLLVFRGKLLDSKMALFHLLTSCNLAHEDAPCMYIHMTLRGGSETATKIGLTSNPQPQQPSSSSSPQQAQAADAQTTQASQEADQEEEEKCVPPMAATVTATSSATARDHRATSSATPPPSRVPQQYPPPPPPYPFAHHHHHPYSYPYPYPHPPPYGYPYGAMPPPPLPPAHAMQFSQSMPDLMARPHMYRQSSAPSNQTFAPPTLVQQTSNPNQSQTPAHPPPHPAAAAGYPYPPPWPAYAHHPSAPPMPPYAYHAYSTSDLYHMHPRDPRMRRSKKKKRTANVPSKIQETTTSSSTTTTEDDQKFVHENADGGGNDPAPAPRDEDGDNRNREPFRGLYGLRQRRGDRAPVPAAENVNAEPAAAADAIVNNNVNVVNANVGVAVANEVPREGIMVRLFRFLNVNVLVRLAIFMWLFGPNLGTYRFTLLCIVGGLYYLYQVGVLQAVLNRFVIARNRPANEPQHRDPNAAQENASEENRAPPPRLTHAQLLQRFLVGLVASLWPTWDHRNLYPAVRQ